MLARRAPLKRTPLKHYRPRPAVSSSLRLKLIERSGGRCEAFLPGCLIRATDTCHRIPRGMGGRQSVNRLSNVWHGCRSCHRWATLRPAEAYSLGLALKDHQDPTVEPMAYLNGGFVLLDDEGFLWPWASDA